jgi:hypothetical protein
MNCSLLVFRISLLHVVERKRSREIAVSVDLRLEISDLLLRRCNRIRAGDEAPRWWLPARIEELNLGPHAYQATRR